MAKQRSFFDRLSYIFFPKEDKGTSWFERWVITSRGLKGEDAWQARMDMPEEKRIVDSLNTLSIKMGVPPPNKVIIYQSYYPNAARLPNGTVAVGTNLINILTPEKMDAVMGHELSHHKHAAGDTGVMYGLYALAYAVMHSTIWPFAASKIKPDSKILKNPTLTYAAMFLADVYAMTLAALPYRKYMESRADREGAEVTSPQAMAESLEALGKRSRDLSASARAHQGLPPEKNWVEKALDGWKHFHDPHPPMKARIEALKKMPSHVEAVAHDPEPVVQRAP